MDLSNPKLRKILVGVAILVVVIFIVIRFFRRSYYSYPNTSEQGSFTISAAAMSAGPPALVTFTTTAPHGFSVGDLVYISGVTGVTYTEPVTGYPPGAGSPVLPPGGSAVYLVSASGSTFAVKATGTTPVLTSAAVKSIVQPAMDKMNNTDLLGCQTQYATDLISATSTLTGSSSQTINNSSARTVNVTSTNGFANGDKVVIPGVVDGAGKASVLIVESVAGNSITFTAGSLPSSATILPQTAVSDITAAYDKRTMCIQTSATTYTIGHCRYLPQAGTNRPIVPLASDDPVAFAAYTQYQTDIQAIQTAYAGPMSRATQNATFPNGGSFTGSTQTPTSAVQQMIIEAARKADLANATQKYLASVCPGFYAQTSSGSVTDPSGDYKNWITVSSDPSSTATATNKRFWAGGVTDASIMTWALGAGVVGLSGPVLSVTIPSGGIGNYSVAPMAVVFSAPPSGGTTATGSVVMSGGKITGVTVTSGGSGYTTNPTITFTGGTPTTAPTAAELASIVVQISTNLSASGPLIGSGTFTPTGGAAVTYSSGKYNLGTGDNVNWRVAYKNGPGTYPRKTYS